MNKINFRAWDGINKEMLYPDGNGYFSSKNDGCFVIDGNGEAISLSDDIRFDTPEKITFMQYVRLKDKNGKEIYEGDIVKTNYKFLNGMYIVEHDKYNPCFALINITDRNILEYDFIKCGMMKLEVIGNKFENPELLNIEDRR